MPQHIVTFDVPGLAVGKGRPRVDNRAGFARLYTPQKTASYEGLVAEIGGKAMAGRPPDKGPIRLFLDIRVPVPQSWSKKKQRLALAGAVWPTTKPDVDNVEKAIADALNQVVWVDDKQVCDVVKRKRYHLTPGIEVTVARLEGEAA